MVFDEFKAAEIIDKYGIPKTKLAIWRSRNAIPNKYFKENFSPIHELLKSFNTFDIAHIQTIINAKKIKLLAINEECRFSKNKIYRAIHRQTRLNYDEVMQLIYEGNKLKKLTKQAINALLDRDKDILMEFFNHKALNIKAILNENQTLINKIKKCIHSKKTPFPFEHAFEIEKQLNIFLLEIKFIIIFLYYQSEFDPKYNE
ncbi:MAG: hypothetical protein WC142_07365 [Bacteroidales bacterium]